MIKKYTKSQNIRVNATMFLIAFIITVFIVVTGGYVQEGYDVEIGKFSERLFKAPREIENVIETQRQKQLAEDSVKEVYKNDLTASEHILNQLKNFFEEADDLREIAGTINFSNETSESGIQNIKIAHERQKLSVYLTDSQFSLLLTLNTNDYKEFANISTQVMLNVIEQGIKADSEEKTLVFVKDELEKLGLLSEQKNLGYEIVSSFLEPNVVVDEEATLKAKEEKKAEVAPVMILPGQKIVGEGEIITEEIYQVLDSLGFINKEDNQNTIQIIGVIFVVLVIFTIFALFTTFFQESLLKNRKEIFLLFTVYLLVIFICRFMIGLNFNFVPIIMGTMLVSILLDSRLAIMFNIYVTVICLLVFKGDINFFCYFLICGTAAALISKYTTERNKVFLVGFILSFINILVIVGISFIFEKKYSPAILNMAVYSGVSGIVSVILCMGSLPFWEGAFGVVTSIKLLELTNPNYPLLRRLTIEAPGTYHHSLIVANLAETAAYDIGANTSLARVGAFYHDIGKLKYPVYFSENQIGKNIHDDMDPYSSVSVITSHVSYGLTLADNHKLPRVLKDIIAEHHGNTLVKFFYHKAKTALPDGAIDESDFRYQHSIPTSKEAAIVMLADTVEAAVRSMIPSGKTMNQVEDFARLLVKDKLDDGQLLESNLTIKDLEMIIKSFMCVFKGMYHERIPYPKQAEAAATEEPKEIEVTAEIEESAEAKA